MTQYKIYKTISDIPEPAVGNFPLTWSGWLQTTSPSSLFVNDANLFDGSPAALIINSGSSPSPPSDLSLLLGQIADPAKRFGVLNGVPSSFFGDTVRDKFLYGSWLSVQTSKSGSLLSSFNTSQSSPSSGTYVSMSGACSSTACPSPMANSLQKFVNGALEGHCKSFSVMEDTISSNINADLFFVGTSALIIRSFSTLTQAIFRCNQGGNATFIGLSLSSEVFSEAQWPLLPFMQDSKAAVGMLQNMPLQAEGFVWGTMNDAGEVYTLVRSDIFAASGGGSVVVDQLIGKSGNQIKEATEQIQDIFGSVCGLLTSNIKPLDESISNLFSVATVGSMIHNYQAETPEPSVAGFMQWFADGTEEQVDIYVTREQIVLVLNVSATEKFNLASSAFSNASIAYQRVNASFAELVEQVQYKYPEIDNYTAPILDEAKITGWHSVWLTSSIIITQIPNGNSTYNVSLGSSTMVEVSAFNAKFHEPIFFGKELWFSEASIVYEQDNVYVEATVARDLQHKLGTTVGLSTDNKLLLSNVPGPNSTLIRSSFLDIAETLSSVSTENANVYINYDISSLCGNITWYQAMIGCSQIDFGTSPTPFEFREAVAEYLSTVCQGSNTTVVVTLQAPKDSSYVLSFITAAVQDMNLSSMGNPWEQIIDTTRLVLPIGMKLTT